jgi:hypothetical protein
MWSRKYNSNESFLCENDVRTCTYNIAKDILPSRTRTGLRYFFQMNAILTAIITTLYTMLAIVSGVQMLGCAESAEMFERVQKWPIGFKESNKGKLV